MVRKTATMLGYGTSNHHLIHSITDHEWPVGDLKIWQGRLGE